MEEASAGIEKACLKRLRESRLKSETVSTLIHILSRCYEDPEASRILSQERTRPGGGSGEGDKVSDGVVMKDDVVKDVMDGEVEDSRRRDDNDDDDQKIELSVDEIENMIMDVDALEGGPVEGSVIDQEALQLVENSLLETVGLGNQVAESVTNDNGFSNGLEVGLTQGEAAQCGCGDDRDDKCSLSENQQLDGPGNALECGNAERANGSGDIEEGEIDNVDVDVPSHVSVEDNIDIVQHTEAGADRTNDIEQRKLPVEDSHPDFSSSGLVGNVDNENVEFPHASSDACAEYLTAKSPDASNSTSEAKIEAITDSIPTNGFRRPIDSRSPVFYGDITVETSPNAQDTLRVDADNIKKKKRGGNSKEKKKIKKRKKRAEMDKKLGVKRMKLPPALKPKVVKVCEHYLKGRCIKGEECTFSHNATPLTKSKACIHFARNNCMKGDACPYDHELWKYPCDNYASKGFCNRGSSCSFSHEIPAQEGLHGASVPDQINLQAKLIPGTASIVSVNSPAKVSVTPPMRIPKGLSFLSLGKPGSDHLTRPDLSRSPQKIDLMGCNHSKPSVSGMIQTLDGTSIPFAPPATSNNHPFLEAQSDQSSNNNISVPGVRISKTRVDLTNPLDQALMGLNSLVSSKVPVNRFSHEARPGLSAKEQKPPMSRLSGLNMNKSSGSSVEKEKSGLGVDQKGKFSKSKSQVVANMLEKATQEKASGVLSSKSLTLEQKSDKIFSIQGRGRQSGYGSPHTMSAEELQSPASVNSPSSQGVAANKSMHISVQKDLLSTSTLASKIQSEIKGSSLGFVGNSHLQAKPQNNISNSQGVAANKSMHISVLKDLLSTSTLTSKIESEIKGSRLGSAGNSQLQAKPHNNKSSSQGVAANKSMHISVPKDLLSTSTLASKIESEIKGSRLGSAGNSQLQAKPHNNISSSQGVAANKSMHISVQKDLLSTSTLASRIESEIKGPCLGSAGNSQLQAKPQNNISSSSQMSFNSEPVKASAILDFIFGTGSKTK